VQFVLIQPTLLISYTFARFLESWWVQHISDNMKRVFILFIFILSSSLLNGQTAVDNSIQKTLNSSISRPDTLNSYMVRKNPPYVFYANLNHKERTFGNKALRGCIYATGYNVSILTYLIQSPTWLSRWDNTSDNFKLNDFFKQYKSSYTKPPVIDEDLFITNYLGHPYQGGFYYNSVRSQGATIWQSAIFSLGQSLLWEFGWEAGFEQPSIQDLIVTPVIGSIYGELTHVATIAMSKHGFRWYEIAAVCVFNPAYAINNGFRFNKPVRVHQ